MMRRRAAVGIGGDDSGITLVEVILYVALSVVIGTITIMIFTSSLTGQSTVTSRTEATTAGDAVARGLERALRNAKAVSIEDEGATLKVYTSLETACQGWRVRAGELQVSTTPGFPESSWNTLVRGEAATPAILPVIARDPAGAVQGSALPFFSPGTQVTYALSFATTGDSVDFRGSVSSRAARAPMGTGC